MKCAYNVSFRELIMRNNLLSITIHIHIYMLMGHRELYDLDPIVKTALLLL